MLKVNNMKDKSDNSNSKGHTRVQWTLAIIVNTTVLTFGLQCGWVSPATKILQSVESPVGRPLTDSEISLIAGLPSLSAIVGILMQVYVADTFGRKYSMLMMALFQFSCWIIKICLPNPESLMVARIFCGLGAGGCFHVIPMYVKEISEDSIRGTLGSIVTLAQNLGILVMYAIGGYLDYYTVLYLVVGLPVLTVAMLVKAPESPSFLVKTERLENFTLYYAINVMTIMEAAKTIAFLRGLHVNHKEVQAEIDCINREDEYFKSIPNISFFKIFKDKAWRRGFFIMLMVITHHGLNGTFAIINYASTLLAKSETKISAELQTLAIPVVLSIGTLITMSFVDRLGRKLMLGIMFIISTLTFGTLASVLLLHAQGWSTPGWLPIVLMLIIACSYGAGVSPIPFIIMPELFNFQIRAKVMGFLCIQAWLMSFVQLISFAAVTSSLGAHMSFYMFGALNLIGAIIVFTLLPETGGKSVDQIEAELRKDKKS